VYLDEIFSIQLVSQLVFTRLGDSIDMGERCQTTSCYEVACWGYKAATARHANVGDEPTE
jgi:hypothetical protein